MASGQNFDGGDLAYQAGCTCCVAIVTKTEIYCANAGDTRCVIGLKGKSKDLSVDHKPDLPAEKRRVQRAGGFVEEAGLMDNRYFKSNRRLGIQKSIIKA